jgi:hypothetical protein
MALGPGKYGANAEQILKTTDGDLCLVVVVGGRDGNSFDCACADPTLLLQLPDMLRDLADSIAEQTLPDVDQMMFGGDKRKTS